MKIKLRFRRCRIQGSEKLNDLSSCMVQKRRITINHSRRSSTENAVRECSTDKIFLTSMTTHAHRVWRIKKKNPLSSIKNAA